MAMSSFAPPVRRGDFLYSSLLYADVGNGNHHPRASVAELMNILRPQQVVVAKKRKNVLSAASEASAQDSYQAKDQVGHFYTAQLVHYGLPQTKDKNTAKVRLLDALNQGKLEVPAWIAKLEGELRREWEAENRKLKKMAKGVKGSVGGRDSGARGGNTQTPFNGVSNSITVNVSLNSPFSFDAQALTQATPISTPSQRATAKKRKVEDSPDHVQTAAPKKYRASQPKPSPGSRLFKEQQSAHPKSSPGPRVKAEPSQGIAARGTPAPSRAIKTEPRTASQPNSSPASSQTSKKIKTERPSRAHQPTPLTGTYTITCPSISAHLPHLPCENLHLTLHNDTARAVWWSSFSCATWTILIQLSPSPSSITLGSPCSLAWRLRDTQTGQLRFGRACTGEMTFFGDRSVRGKLDGVPVAGTVEFWGERVPGGGGVGDGVGDGDAFQWAWEGFVREAYGR